MDISKLEYALIVGGIIGIMIGIWFYKTYIGDKIPISSIIGTIIGIMIGIWFYRKYIRDEITPP